MNNQAYFLCFPKNRVHYDTRPHIKTYHMYIYFPKDENDRYHGSIHNPLSNRASQVFDMHVQFQKLLVIHLSTKFDVMYDIEHHGYWHHQT